MIQYSSEVTNALSQKRPLVALESTIISHGLPRPKNLEVALEVEEIVRSEGATPATIAIIDGQIHVGLEKSELDRVANDENFTKASIRDLATVTATGLSAATTVAATSHIAHLAGIEYFATGGLGGVHRGAQESWDESADLLALANIPVLVVCAGVKSILDIPATLERLETLSVPVIGYRTKKFPGFYLPDSGSMNQMLHERLLKDGLTKARDNNVTGKAVTPFLLEFFHANSDGESLKVNIEIIKSNSKLAAQIASS
ncbi:MAG: hypothetical protein RL673_284 [Actinomycetota bacterium]